LQSTLIPQEAVSSGTKRALSTPLEGTY